MIIRNTLLSCFLGALLSIFVFSTTNAQVNAGFVQGLWYSKPTFFADETIRIYSAIQNQSDYDITGKVEFIVNEEVIGSSSFSAISGRLIESWTDWTVKKGKNDVYVRIIDAKKNVLGKSPESIILAFNKSQVDNMVVDIDTDKDGIGNEKDEDDDNDTLSDEQEKELKTDPLKKDTDNDGINDNEEQKRGTNPLKTDNTSYRSEQYALGNAVSGTLQTNNNSGSYKKEKKYKIKESLIALPAKFSERTDNIADKLTDVKKDSNNNSFSTFLTFLIFILKHKILLVMVILAILVLSYKVFKFFARWGRRL